MNADDVNKLIREGIPAIDYPSLPVAYPNQVQSCAMVIATEVSYQIALLKVLAELVDAGRIDMAASLNSIVGTSTMTIQVTLCGLLGEDALTALSTGDANETGFHEYSGHGKLCRDAMLALIQPLTDERMGRLAVIVTDLLNDPPTGEPT